ncbi:MAG: hypothetical protein MR004_03125 [Clostridiales bacterium]|nr:hypothetical protein [Clostridiales bacterium]
MDRYEEGTMCLTDKRHGLVRKAEICFHGFQERKSLVYHVSDSINRERLERFMFGTVEESFYREMKERSKAMDVPDEVVRNFAGFCCYSGSVPNSV